MYAQEDVETFIVDVANSTAQRRARLNNEKDDDVARFTDEGAGEGAGAEPGSPLAEQVCRAVRAGLGAQKAGASANMDVSADRVFRGEGYDGSSRHRCTHTARHVLLGNGMHGAAGALYCCILVHAGPGGLSLGSGSLQLGSEVHSEQ